MKSGLKRCVIAQSASPSIRARIGVAKKVLKMYIIQGRLEGGGGIPVFPKKNRKNTPKYPKFLQIYPKLIEALCTACISEISS